MTKGIALSIFAAVLLAGCGSAKLPSLTTGSVSQSAQPTPTVDDPLARAVEVGVTSAQAEKCGYFFDPQQLRANYLAAEAQRTAAPATLHKVETAYDFARLRVTRQIAKAEGYCSKAKTAQIRSSLNRYLAGDFQSVRKRQVAQQTGFGWFDNEPSGKVFNLESIHDPLLNDKTKSADDE